MRGTRTALDLESEDMEDIALHVEELERYGTAEEFYRPGDDESVVSSIGCSFSVPPFANPLEEEDVPCDEKEEDEKGKEEKGVVADEHLQKAVGLLPADESICEEDGPPGMFSFSNLAEDQTAISTLGSPSIIYQSYFPPERAIDVAPQEPIAKETPNKDNDNTEEKEENASIQPEETDEEQPRRSDVNAVSQGGFRGLLCNHPCHKLEIAAVILSFTAFVLTGTATDRCDFLKLENDQVPTFWDLPERAVGLVQFETLAADAKTSQCLYWFDYPDAADILYDNAWHAARILSVIATFFGLFFVGFISTFSCIAYKVEVFQRLAYASLIIPLLHGLSFVVFGSDVCLEGTCEIGVGGILMVLGVIAWLILAAVLHMIPGAHPKLPDQKEGMVDAAKRSAYLGLAMICVMIIVVVVNLSVIFGRDLPEVPEAVTSSRPPKAQENTDWLQAGETTQGPYPDTHDFLSLSGDASVMSVIGKESVLTLEFDVVRNLWYPFGNMIAANLDPVGRSHGDRVTKFRASSATLSENGHVISVGSSNWAQGSEGGEEYEFGKVETWKYHTESRRWIPKGPPITGKSKGDAFASKVKVSKDGRRLAVLASGHFGKHQPYVRVYQYDDVYEKTGSWVQLGGDIMLESFWTASGFAFSGDGSSVTLGSLRIGRLGLVTVWHYDEGTETWNRRGSPISSGSSNREDEFGTAVAISGNGAVLVVGDPGGVPSYARAFWLNELGEWEQLGQDLECDLDGGRCAHDVAMSKFGSTIAITGYSYHQFTRAYYLDILKKTWVQLGDDMEIAKSDEAAEGTAIDLSSDGRSVAFGVTFEDTQTQVWKYNGEIAIDGSLQSAQFTPSPSLAPISGAPPVLPERPISAQSTAAPATQLPTSSAPLPTAQLATRGNMTNDNATLAISTNESAVLDLAAVAPTNQSVSDASNSTAAAKLNETGQPWISTVALDDVAYFLFESFPRVERYDMLAQKFLPSVVLPTTHGPATALGICRRGQMYVGYGTQVFRYWLNGTDETQIAANAKAKVIGFHFDSDLVFINAGQYFISVDGRTNTMIKQFFSFNEMEFGTTISVRHRRIFGRTPDELAVVSGDIIRRSDLWFKEYNEQGDFVNEKLARLDQKVDLESASKTWMFPDQTRVVDDKGYVFSVAGAEHVYSINTTAILDIAWLGGEVMIALHSNGSLSAISQELTVTGSHNLENSPANIAVVNGQVFTFTHDLGVEGSVQVNKVYLGLLKPSLPGRSINPTNVPFSPEFVFVDNQGLLYMLSKGHSSIFVMEPAKKKYLESIKLDEVPKYMAYSGANHEVYTLRENSVLSKINLTGENKTEVAIATLPSPPLGLSTAGEFIFACDDTGAFATHYTLMNNGTIVSSVDWNHYDTEFVWSDANRKMYFFRQADPTDLMTEHIFENGTIGNRVDSFLNTNSGFEHPIRVDSGGHHALLGSGIIHNAKSLKRMDRTFSNSFIDAAFGKGFVHTIRNVGEDMVQLQQWHGHTFALQNVKNVGGRAHRILSLSKNKTVALTANATGIPAAYVLDENLNVS